MNLSVLYFGANLKRISLSVVVTALVGIGAFGLTQAFFSDTETSVNNILAAGKIDLKVDNTSYYNGVFSQGTSWELSDLSNQLFFNFTDIKPSDLGEDTISLHVDDNDSWACMDLSLTKNDDVTCTTPESIDDPTCNESNGNLFDGELGSAVNFIFWNDDGDNVLEIGESTITSGSASSVLGSSIILADSQNNNVGSPSGTPLTGGQTYYIGKAWCFGTLTTNPLVQDGQGLTQPIGGNGPDVRTTSVTCNGASVNNAAQSDALMGDITFRAVQHRNNPNFLCVAPSITPTPTITPSVTPSITPSVTPTPPQFSCEPNNAIFASSSFFNNQGTRKDSSAILVDRTNPASMFGAPQTSGADSDVGFPAGSFFALGFTGGNIVLGFANPFFNGPGNDLQVFEVTGGVYPDEIVKVEVGPTSTGPWTVVAAAATRDEAIDINPVPSAQFVRLTDVSNIALFPNDADAYDVDAVKAFCTIPQ